MSRDPEPNEIPSIGVGFLLLLFCHVLAIVAIFGLASIVGNNAAFSVLIIGIAGLLFWQLLYVIPLTLWLKNQRKFGMMKGVIIGAVLTALLNGACFLGITTGR